MNARTRGADWLPIYKLDRKGTRRTLSFHANSLGSRAMNYEIAITIPSKSEPWLARFDIFECWGNGEHTLSLHANRLGSQTMIYEIELIIPRDSELWLARYGLLVCWG